MIRNYNGKINRAMMRDLRKICEMFAENEQNLLEVFKNNGKVMVYENYDTIWDYSENILTVVELTKESEIEEYIKNSFMKMLNEYLKHKMPIRDYFMKSLIEFVKENGKFPGKDAMTQLEKNAEKKRISKLSNNIRNVQNKLTKHDIIKEVLELAEEIIEARLVTNPKDISVNVKKFSEELTILDDKIDLVIKSEGSCDYTDDYNYSCLFYIKEKINIINNIDNILFYYRSDGIADVAVEGIRSDNISTNVLLCMHKFIVKKAREEEIEFTSEIDYSKFQQINSFNY